MNKAVNAVADSIANEVSLANDWTIQRFDPLWRNPEDGPTLYVFGTRQFPGEFRTTGSREDIYEVTVEYVEASGSQAEELERDEEAELAFADTMRALREWADDHQSLGLSGGETAHRLDYLGISFPADVRREMAVRYGQMTLHLRRVAEY